MGDLLDRGALDATLGEEILGRVDEEFPALSTLTLLAFGNAHVTNIRKSKPIVYLEALIVCLAPCGPLPATRYPLPGARRFSALLNEVAVYDLLADGDREPGPRREARAVRILRPIATTASTRERR